MESAILGADFFSLYFSSYVEPLTSSNVSPRSYPIQGLRYIVSVAVEAEVMVCGSLR